MTLEEFAEQLAKSSFALTPNSGGIWGKSLYRTLGETCQLSCYLSNLDVQWVENVPCYFLEVVIRGAGDVLVKWVHRKSGGRRLGGYQIFYYTASDIESFVNLQDFFADVVRKEKFREFPGQIDKYEAYVATSCMNINPRITSAYYTILKDGKIFKEAGKGFVEKTDNRACLLGIISIVEAVPEFSHVTIYTANDYCLSALSLKWWKEHANNDLIETFLAHSQNRSVKLKPLFNSKNTQCKMRTFSRAKEIRAEMVDKYISTFSNVII